MISGLNRTAFDLAVYASQGWSPTRHARLASGCWSGSTGRDWLPAGFHLKGFKLRLSSSPELSWRDVGSSFRAKLEIRCQFIILAQSDNPVSVSKPGVSPLCRFAAPGMMKIQRPFGQFLVAGVRQVRRPDDQWEAFQTDRR